MPHWSDYTSCSCGATFRVGSTRESVHRHNFPLLCKKPKAKKGEKRVSEPSRLKTEA
jgi:hypothetical protein